MNVRGRGIVITRATKRLGTTIEYELAKRGARLFLVARHDRELDMVVRSLRARGAEAHGWAADVGNKEAVYPLAGAAQAALGQVDMVIHNASTLGPSPLRPLLDTE